MEWSPLNNCAAVTMPQLIMMIMMIISDHNNNGEQEKKSTDIRLATPWYVVLTTNFPKPLSVG